MIQNRSAADRTVEGNLTGEVVQMGAKNIGWLLNIVTDLYADRELACIREYSTNALDAHVEARINVPIEVTTPSALSPFLVIRDYGIGLSLDDIREIYSQYGESTKRGTNDQTGMLGVGCKSALSYSDQFTVTSVKDGVRIQVVVSRDSNGASMKVVDTSDTSDPAGTTVTIPARSYNQIDSKAKRFFSHWRSGTVKLNGREPEFMPNAKRVTDKLYLLESSSTSYVVMGGVPYPATIEHGLGWNKGIVAFVGIGEVDFAPSRESLMDTDTTQATLRNVKVAFQAALSKSISDDITASSTCAEAARKNLEWRRRVPAQYIPKNVMFKGVMVPDSYKVERDLLLAPTYYSKMSAHSTYQTNNHLPLPTVNEAVWVTGFDYASFTATVRKKLDKYVEEKGITGFQNYVLWASNSKPDTTWMENVRFVDWPTIKAIKLPRSAPNPKTGRIPGSYDLYDGDGGHQHGVPGDDIDSQNELFWMLGGQYAGKSEHQRLLKSYPDCTLVMLRAGREAKFQRLFPEAREAMEVLKEEFEVWKSKINKDDAAAYMMANSADSRLKALDETRLDDPEIKRIKGILNRDTSKLANAINEWQCLGFYWTPEDIQGVSNPLDKYILLPDSYYFPRLLKRQAEHIYSYMNNAYADWKAAQ